MTSTNVAFIASLLLVFGESLRADEPQPEAETVKVALHAQAAPRPALKHRLLPSLVDQRPGNAAL